MKQSTWYQKIFGGYRRTLLISAIFFLPLVFLNIRHDHDWGGDFAQYMAQADNIAHLRPMSATAYVYNEAYPSLAPKAYPPGFPLLIAPIAFIYDNYIPPYLIFISLLLMLTALMSVFLLKQRIGLIAAISLSIVIYYNPVIVSFKSEIMADIPFALLFIVFLLFTVVTHKEISIKRWIWAGIVAGLASVTKTAGYCLLLAMLAYATQLAIIEVTGKKKLAFRERQFLAPLSGFASGLFVLLLFSLVFSGSGEGSVSYLNSFDFKGLLETIQINVFNYSEALRGFFSGQNTPHQWFGALTGSAILTFFITGFIMAVFRKPGIMEWLIVSYLGLLFVYPYHHSGFRFLIPVAPVILFYSAYAVHSLKPGRGGVVLAVIIAFMMAWDYFPRLKEIHKSSSFIQEGPYKDIVINAFGKIKLLTPENALIVFNKPTVLAKYTGRKSLALKPLSSEKELTSQINHFKPDYLLKYRGLPDQSLDLLLFSRSNEYELIYNDSDFWLYKRR